MRRRHSGQSLVEMAFVFPVLILVLFGIIDISYYIYGYATIYQAARNGAEEAAQTPPYSDWISPSLDANDVCVANILEAVQYGAVLFPDLTDTSVANRIQIRYPLEGVETNFRTLGQPIEVSITYDIDPLTPLWRFVMFGNNGKMTVQTTARRSIESLGKNPAFMDQGLTACHPRNP